MEQRTAGVLLPISALPSQYAIGDFGKEAYQFIDYLKETSMHIWQILPLNPLGYGNSPYQPFSSKAGEPLYISLDLLYEEGYIHKPTYNNSPSSYVDYELIKKYKAPYFKEAFENFKLNKKLQIGYDTFIKENDWVYYYAVFYTLKYLNGEVCWIDWKKEDKDWIETKIPLTHHQDLVQQNMFLQYIFFKQWFQLKKYANQNDVQILGDLPFYVGIDSLDVWMNQENFLLDGNKNPTYIAGVPPDYFSPTGQRWGNPIYDWDYLEENDFEFWIDRIHFSSKMYDYIRIDHFRAFDTYWKIPSRCPTAIEGEWIEAPGFKFFNLLYKKYPSINIIAEDLGDLRDEVYELRDNFKLPGMQVIQFHLNPKKKNPLLENTKNMVIYTGTHDNQTLFSWYLELPFDTRRNIWTYLVKKGYKEKTIDVKILHYCLDSKAKLVIFPIQDILCMKDEARINTPGTLGSPNWEFSLQSFNELYKNQATLKQLLQQTNRG